MQALTSYPLTVKDTFTSCLVRRGNYLRSESFPLEHSSHLCVEQIVEVWPLLSKWWWESQGHFLFSSWSTFLSFHDKACSLSYRNFQGLSPWNLIYNTGNHKRPTLQKGTRPWKLSRWFTTVIFLKDRKPKAPGLFLQVPFYPPLPLSSRQLPCFLTIPMLQSWTFICFLAVH